MYLSAALGQVVAIVLIGVFAAFFTWNAYRKRENPAWVSIVQLSIAALLHLTSAIYAFARPITFTTRVLDVLPLHQSLVFAYIIIDQLLNGRPYRPAWQTRLFYVVLLLSSAILTLDWLQRDNLASFPDGDLYQPTALFYISTAANWAVITWLLGAIAWLCYTSLSGPAQATHRVRTGLIGVAFGIACLGLGAATEVNLAIVVGFGDAYRQPLDVVYQSSRIAAFTLVMIGLTAPNACLSWLSRPIERRRTRQLCYLRDQLLAIARSRYRKERNDSISVIVEISDLARLIWTNTQRAGPVTPQQEAEHIFALLTRNAYFAQAGPYRPPQLAYPDVIQHYVQVARRLRRLERSRASPAYPAGKRRIES